MFRGNTCPLDNGLYEGRPTDGMVLKSERSFFGVPTSLAYSTTFAIWITLHARFIHMLIDLSLQILFISADFYSRYANEVFLFFFNMYKLYKRCFVFANLCAGIARMIQTRNFICIKWRKTQRPLERGGASGKGEATIPF